MPRPLDSLSLKRKQRRPGPENPDYAIPREQWPDIIRRLEQGDSFRQLARDYQTTPETIRRVSLAMGQPSRETRTYAIPKEQWADILHRVAQNESYRQIARVYQVSPDTIRQIVLRTRSQSDGQNLSVSLHYAIPRDQWPDIIRRVREGESLRQIALDFNVGRETVRRLVERLRKEEAGQNLPTFPNKPLPRDQWSEVMRRVQEGESQREIAKALGTTREKVRHVIRAMRNQQQGGKA